MDIIEIKGISTANYTHTNDTKKSDKNNETSENQGITQDLGTDTFVKSAEKEVTDSTYKPIKKKLSTEEISAIKDSQENLKTELIKKFISDTINNQNKLLGKATESGISKISKESTDLLTKIFGSLENAYPEMATTPEGAKQAIEDGGPYSINAVADRIMTMAKSLAGDDPNKIQQMRAAVEKGFSQAGIDFNKATKTELPQICKDTCTEVMRRFDELQIQSDSSTEKV